MDDKMQANAATESRYFSRQGVTLKTLQRDSLAARCVQRTQPLTS